MNQRLHWAAAIAVPSRQKMHVKMVHFLSTRSTLIDADRDAVRTKPCHKKFHCFLDSIEKRRNFFIRKRY